MLMLPITKCRAGMKLAKKVFSDEGQVLLSDGIELTDKFLDRLKNKGINYLYIEDPRLEGVVIPELLSEETMRESMRVIRDSFRNYADSSKQTSKVTYPYVGKNMRNMMKQIMQELEHNREAMIMLMNMNTVDQYLYVHSMNVCVYATLLGIANGYDEEKLMTLGLGAMLHDIGKTQISRDILMKPDQLSDGEYMEMKRHAERGYYLLKDEPNIPLLSAHCAYQHHERLNGTGYPRGLKGDEIHEFAKWLGIVDSYDAMTSNRIYRNARLPHQAMEILFTGSETLYDTRMLSVFRDKVAIYPIGISVNLSNGLKGVVVHVNPQFIQRPVVRIMMDEDGQPVQAPYDLDLAVHLNVMIVEINFDQAAHQEELI